MTLQDLKAQYNLQDTTLTEFPEGSGWYSALYPKEKVHVYVHEDNLESKLEAIPRGTKEYQHGTYETFLLMPHKEDQKSIRLSELS